MYEGFYLRQELKDEKKKELRLARIEELENMIFERAIGVIDAALSFVEVSPDQTEAPAAWIAELGQEAAAQKLKIAQMGYLPASLAPNAFKLAVQVKTGISRGRAWNLRLTQNNLNVKIALPAPTTAEHPGATTYEVRELEP